MTSLVDRVCVHGYVYCPVAGCHDNIPYVPGPSLRILADVAEGLANDDLSSFYTRPDTWSGYDGPDEAVDQAIISLTLQGWDKGEGWCEA